ncbi:MAG: PLP-dependent transferase, partial [Spirochaetales bacterium]|nr:PLP-dependent transferase [Spirochaetales bacterium]
GLEIARWLEQRPEVEAVYHPFLPSHPQHELAHRLMRGGGGLFSFRLKTRNLRAVSAFADALRTFRMAVSWGGYESLALPIAALYPEGAAPEDRISMVRLHIGLESLELLREDLERGFETLKNAI